MSSGPGLSFAQPIPRRILGVQPLVVPVCGWLTGDVSRVGFVSIEVDGAPAGELRLDEPVPLRLWTDAPPGDAPARGFAGEVTIPAAPSGARHAVVFTAVLRDEAGSSTMVFPVERDDIDKADPAARGLTPAIAICMAVYNPDRSSFERQVESILAQTREDWICIVNDDGSDDAGRAVIDEVTGRDSRFFYFRNESNLGFYGNFEACLARVPDSVAFVALADQDDDWYPDKLERLADELDDGALLSFCDMRLVDEGGNELAPSYWGYRKNSWQDLGLMLVANTVTGAASMMRRELLDVLLPFPPRVGHAFHDHWIACSALARGRIAYVDRPLYDYVQHGNSIIGHCGFDSPGPRAGLSGNPLRLLNPVNVRSLAGRFVGAGQAVYWHECRRIESICANILARGGSLPERDRTLSMYGRGLRSMRALLALNLKHRDSARLTDNAERRLAHGYFVHSAMSALQRKH